MNRTTVQDAMNSRLPFGVGVGPTDPRFLAWLNEATQRLLFSGKWFGTVARYNICAQNGCITLPRGIATIEAVNTCGIPTPIRDLWYEFLANGFGTRDSQKSTSGCCGAGWPSGFGFNESIYRGRYPTFVDIKGTTSKVNVVCDLSADVGNKVLVMGYDQNNNWIRTIQGGVYADGEVIPLAQSTGTTSVNFFSAISGIQFLSPMNGQSWLYQYDTSTNPVSLTLLGHYQYDETNPSYARYFFPCIPTGNSSSGGCQQTKIEILGKQEFMPVKLPNDFLILGNLPALKEMMMAVKKSENEPDSLKANAIIASGIKLATDILDAELDHERGSGIVLAMTVVGSNVGSIDPVPNFY